jgi:hypothetical protein
MNLRSFRPLWFFSGDLDHTIVFLVTWCTSWTSRSSCSHSGSFSRQ